MSVQTTLGEQQLQLPKEDKTERDVIFTANGSREASETAWRTGALVGYESLNIRPPESIPVEFVDWPFTKIRDMDDPDLGEVFEDHLKVVKSEKPKYAVAPDVNDFTSFEDALTWADELQEYAETVIMVPKAVLPSDIPPEFRVGMPCQARFGPPPWKWRQYKPCNEVHCLGGSPIDHTQIMKYSIPVESVDTAVPVYTANFGSYWGGRKWEKGDFGYYGSI